MSFPKRPTILLGAARSGTSILAQMLGEHPDIAYFGENDFIWRYGHAFRSSDVIKPDEATPEIKAYIRSKLHERFSETEGGHRLEKTPGNCFRVPFILEVFPNARFIHIIRDGRDVAFSAADVWSGGRLRARREKENTTITRNGTVKLNARDKMGRLPWIWRMFRSKLRLAHRDISDFQSFLVVLERASRGIDFFRRHVLNNSTIPWGPRVPGLRAIRRSHTLLETCALQWSLSVQAVQSALMQLPAKRSIDVRYEDLIPNPSTELLRVLDFMKVNHAGEQVERMAQKVDNRSVPSWPQNLSPTEVSLIEQHIGSHLQDLNYTVSERRHTSKATSHARPVAR